MAQPPVYNELNGTEVREVVESRCRQMCQRVPYLQSHLTMPRVRITLQVVIQTFAEQPTPDTYSINDAFDVVCETEPEPVEVITMESVDSTAPEKGGRVADQIREMHGLPLPGPERGPRNIGAQIVTADYYAALEGRTVEDIPGLTISRTGKAEVVDGLGTQANATVARIDQGPAGLRSQEMNRDAYHFGRK